jgi:ATP-dependent helicase/DNAse subunit B
MPNDKFSAVWVSHSSINDYLNCPRLYYLRAIYKDPRTGHKITHMQPPLALGQIVHDVLQSLTTLPAEERLRESLLTRLDQLWPKVAGKLGGFRDSDEEKKYKDRAVAMLERVMNNPGPIARKAIKIRTEDGSDLPYYWFHEEEKIILCGKVDWLMYDEPNDGVHIIDFKTGKHDEAEDSLQLPIYHLIVCNTQKRRCIGASYWYLDREDSPQEMELPDTDQAYEKVYSAAHRIVLARKLDHFKCATNGCRYCYPLEEIVRGRGQKVGISDYNQDIYVL